MPRNSISTLLCGIVAGMLTACAPVTAANTSKAATEVLERTKTTNSTYALYIWNRVTKPGEPAFEEGSAEFHRGNLHRVETPRDRIVADCRAKTGAYMSVASGEMVEGPEVAAAACGINTNAPMLSVELLPNVQTKFGVAQRVRVTDKDNIREYSVLKNGALVRTIYTENRPGGQVLIVAEAVRVENSIPDDAMFNKATLATSFLPTDLQR